MTIEEKEIQKYRDILKYRHLTPEENEEYAKLIDKKLAKQTCPSECYAQTLQNIKATGLYTNLYDMPMGLKQPTNKEYIETLKRNSINVKKDDK